MEVEWNEFRKRINEIVYYPTSRFSPNTKVNDQILWLLEQGYPTLPIAPAQDAKAYPKVVKGKIVPGERQFCGKNPSYLDSWGYPKLIYHIPYQRHLPTKEEIRAWFVNPETGIATMGGWQSTVWIDVDSKHFNSPEHCWFVMKRYLSFAPKLRNSYVEVTQSGGLHIAVKVKRMPDFTHFAFEPGGRRIGEVLGTGRVVVLAPTQGMLGQYRVLKRNPPVLIKDLCELSLYSQSNRHRAGIKPTAAPLPPMPVSGSGIALESVLCSRVRGLLDGIAGVAIGMRSDVLRAIAREVFGWESWLTNQGLALNQSAEGFCYQAGMRSNIDCDRIGRILNGSSGQVPIRNSLPSIHFYGGDAQCWRVIRKRAQP